jgi:hypothetical protein
LFVCGHLEREDDAITICEIKCTSEPFILDKNCYHSIANKVSVYQRVTKNSKQLFIALVSANGIKKSAYANKFIGIMTVNDLLVEI